MALVCEPTDALETARAAADAWTTRTPDATSRVRVSFSGATGPVPHAPDALTRALDALLDNALRHGKRDAVHVHIEGHPGRLVVADDGGAWDVAAPDRLGQPASPGQRGTPRPGMGLHRARRLMERMGGALRATERTEAPGAYAVTLEFGPR